MEKFGERRKIKANQATTDAKVLLEQRRRIENQKKNKADIFVVAKSNSKRR